MSMEQFIPLAKQAAQQMLIARRIEMENNAAGAEDESDEDQEWIMNDRELYQQWKHEQINQGHLEGIQSSILQVYAARFGNIPAHIEQAVRRKRDTTTLLSWCNLFATHTPEQIDAALALQP